MAAASVASIRRDRTSDGKTRVYVVEDHDEALSCIHDTLRARVLPWEFTVVHFDAHPDLTAVDDMPADVAYGRCGAEALVNALAAAPAGIAAWMLPLVVAGHVRAMEWVRSPWSQQIPDGVHDVLVGEFVPSGGAAAASAAAACPGCDECGSGAAWAPRGEHDGGRAAVLRVACRGNMYYAREGVLVPSCALSSARKLVLSVHDGSRAFTTLASAVAAHGAAGGAAALKMPWLLDVDLDYFTTQNPQWRELRALVGADDAETVRTFVATPALFSGTAPSAALCAVAQAAGFSACVGEVFSDDPVSSRRRHELSLPPELLAAYSRLCPSGSDARGALHRALEAARRMSAEALAAARRFVSVATAPDHESSWDEIRTLVSEFAFALRSVHPPCAVTIARSAADGYSSPDAADAVEAAVLSGAPARPCMRGVILSAGASGGHAALAEVLGADSLQIEHR